MTTSYQKQSANEHLREDTAGCPLCGSRRVKPQVALTEIVRAAPDLLVKCEQCGLVYRTPPLSIARAAEIYDDAYYRQYEQSMGMAGDLNGVARTHLKRRLMEVEARTGVGFLLEIGCGNGAFLEFAGTRGWKTQGVEISSSAGAVARKKGLDIHIGPVETMPQLPRPVDFIHMNHVLEHLPDPVGVLRQVCSLLVPQGVAVIEVPNEFANLFFLLGRAVLPMSRLKSVIPSTHQCFFTPATLCRAMRASGLKVDRIRTVRWTIGDRSGPIGRAIRRGVYMIERPLGRAGNIEVTVRRTESNQPGA